MKIIAVTSTNHSTRDKLVMLLKFHLFCYKGFVANKDLSGEVKNAMHVVNTRGHEDDCFDSDLQSYTDRFANPIKTYLSSVLGIPAKNLNDSKIKDTVFPEISPLSVREMHKIMDKLKDLMQNESLYAVALFNRVKSLPYSPRYVFIKDLRFEAEAKETLLNNGYILSCANEYYPEIQKYCSHKVHLTDDFKADSVAVLNFLKWSGLVSIDYAEQYENTIDS